MRLLTSTSKPEYIVEELKREEQKEKNKQLFGKIVICLETGKEFASANEAGNILGVDGSNIRSSCRLGIQTKIGKQWFHFYYRNEPKPVFLHNRIKKVINVETNEIFENLIEAAKSIGKSSKLYKGIVSDISCTISFND